MECSELRFFFLWPWTLKSHLRCQIFYVLQVLPIKTGHPQTVLFFPSYIPLPHPQSIVTMGKDRVARSSRSSSPLSFPSSPSLSSVTSSTTRASKKAFKSVKNVVKQVVRPFKKARKMPVSSNASTEAFEGGMSLFPIVFRYLVTKWKSRPTCINRW